MFSNYPVQFIFNAGSGDYILPHVFEISDPKEGMKATVINGTRADGAVIIPGGKRSQNITIKGNLFATDGYNALSALISTLKSSVTTNVATLTVKYYASGIWQTDESWTVRRIEEITFPQSYRLDAQEYNVSFLVISY
jgi:hypothetical protein